MVRSMIKYGVIGGLVLTALFGIVFLSGLYLRISFFGAHLLGILIIILGLMVIAPAVLHQKHIQGGGIGFKKAFGIGMGVSAITALVYLVAALIIFSLVFASYDQAVLEFGQMPNDAARWQELEMSATSPIYYKPWLQTVATLTAIVPIGLFMSFVSARLTNTRP